MSRMLPGGSHLLLIGAGTFKRPRRSSAARRLGPWGLSILLHAVLISLGCAITWSIIRLDEQLPSPVITSEVVAMTPVMPLRTAPEPPARATVSVPVPSLEPVPATRPRVEGPPPAETNTEPPAAFAGESTAAAQRVVFLIDASGSMVAWLPFVLDEVERTLAAMRPTQRFAVVCFSGEDVRSLPAHGLVAATPAETRPLMRRLRTLTAQSFGDGSDPVPGFRAALALQPELVLLLSEGLDGRGRWAVDRGATMRALEGLNPSSAAGRRPVQINCIRLASSAADAAAVLMQDIDATHGDGAVTTVSLEDLDP